MTWLQEMQRGAAQPGGMDPGREIPKSGTSPGHSQGDPGTVTQSNKSSRYNPQVPCLPSTTLFTFEQIGRASCRERV